MSLAAHPSSSRLSFVPTARSGRNSSRSRTSHPTDRKNDRNLMGPLNGIKVIEFEAIGPGPFCGMMLADMGADVLVIDRPGATDLGLGRERRHDTMMRGRRSVTLDMKSKG